MCVLARLLVVVVALMCAAVTSQQECSPVFETKLQCVSDSSTIDILCPPIEGAEHAILVGRAVVMQALPQNGCTPSPSDCINSAVTNRLRLECNGQSACSYTLQPEDISLNACPQFGEAYLKVEYNCLALPNQGSQARAVALCTETVYEVSNFHMDSRQLAFLNQTFTENDCVCSVDVPAGAEMRIDPFHFVKIPSQPADSCEQRVEFWTQYGMVQQFCTTGFDDDIVLPCSEFNTTYYARYVTEDTSVAVAYILNFNVNSERLITANCNANFDFIVQASPTPSTTTTTTTTTTTPTTTTTTTTPTTTTTTTPTTTTTTTSTTTTATPATTTTTPTTATTTTSTTTPTTTATTAPATTTATTPATTATTATATTTATTDPPCNTCGETPSTGENEDDGDVDIWPIIVGILGGAVLFLLVTCLLIGLCYRGRSSEKEVFVEPAESERSSGGFTYVTEIYVDGNQKRHLMVGQPASFMVTGRQQQAYLQ